MKHSYGLMVMTNQPKEAYDAQKIHHTPHLGTLDNPYKISASFSELTKDERRPHVKIQVAQQHLWALLDSGAAISLISKKAVDHLIKFKELNFHQLQLQVQDCHSNVRCTEGAVTITFDILPSATNTTAPKQVKAVFHITPNLSSDFLFGCDVLSILGCSIDFVSHQVKFQYREAATFLNAKHPLFVAAATHAKSNIVDKELEAYVHKYTFAASPTTDITINPGDQKSFRVTIETDLHLQLAPGAMVFIEADGLNTSAPMAVLEATFANVEYDNKLSITMANKSTEIAMLKKDYPIPGLIIQSMCAFHTPIQIDKDDLAMMANISKTVQAAEAIDPAFKEAIYQTAAARAIIPDKPTNQQYATDDVIFDHMRDSYKAACSALRKTGRPLPGRTTKPEVPCPKDTAINLISQLNLDNCDKEWRQKYVDIVLDNYDVFSTDRYDLGHADHYEHVIEPVEEGLQPPFVKQFPIPTADEALLDDMAKNLTQRKVVIPQFSPGNSPVFIVRKAGNGSSQPRFVQDLRAANSLTKQDRYQIRDIKESLNQAGKAKPKLFSSLDLSGSFWQLSLSEESRPWSAFTLPFLAKQFVWTRTPMGARGSTASFAKFLHIVFQDHPDIITFVDDLMTMSQTHEEMLASLDKIFTILRLHNLKLNLKKCRFGCAEIDWLGFTINKDGIKPELSKVEKCRKLQPPTTSKEIQSMLPFMAFNSQCLEEFQLIAGPLTNLTRKDSPWKSVKKDGPLPSEALTAFHTLRNMLVQRPLVHWPNTSLPFQMFCDASVGTEEAPGGISAVLTQVVDGVTKVIGYYSRRLRASENKYNSFNAELASIVAALDHWRPLLVGSDLTIFTDHLPIVSHVKRPMKTMSALVFKIAEFDCQIRHLMGPNNTIADYLSRNLLDEEEADLGDNRHSKQVKTASKSNNSNTGFDSIKITKKSKQTSRAGRTVHTQSVEAADKDEPTAAQGDNSADNSVYSDSIQNKQQIQDMTVKSSQNISNSLQQGDCPIIDSSTRMALIAKEHRSLGLVGSRKRLKAQGIAAAGVADLSSKQYWQQKQQEDPITKTLIDYIVLKKRPPQDTQEQQLLNATINDFRHKCDVEDGILYYFGRYRKSPLTKKMFVPSDLVTPVIADAHQAATAGHFAPETTIATLMQTYFWLSMAADVSEFIRTCQTCYEMKDPNALASKSHMQHRKVPPRPNYRVHVDLVGPLYSPTGHRFSLTMVDALTRWTVLIPLKSKEADEVAEAIVNNWVLTIGNPQYLVSDMGSEFLNKTVEAVAKFMEIKLHTTAAYSPKSNGAAERIHRTLKRFLTIYTDTLGSDWVSYLPSLAYSLNVKCHSSTGYSPWFLHYGRYPVHPWRNQLQQTKRYGEDEATKRMNLIEYALQMVHTRDTEAKMAFQKAYNKKCREKTFNVGDAVLVHFPPSAVRGSARVNRKFTKPWHGIYFVQKVLDATTFIVKKQGGRKTKCPADRLRLFNEFLHIDDPEIRIAPEDEQEDHEEQHEQEDLNDT